MRPQDKHKSNPYLYPLLQRLQRNVRYLRFALHLTLDCALPLPSRTPCALFDFTPRCLWRVQVYDNCRLIDGDFLRKQDESLAWLGVHYPGTASHQANNYVDVLRILREFSLSKEASR